jgi:hypothetical protein
VTGNWRKLHNEELNLFSPNIKMVISRKMAVMRSVYRAIIRKPERKQ